MLIIDSGIRFRSYCLLLLGRVEIDERRLRERSETYGVLDAVDELLAYLDSRGERTTPLLPSWEEFRELADDYGVAV